MEQFNSFIKDTNRVDLLDGDIYDFIHYGDYESSMKELIKNGIEFRILVMDPAYNESDVVTKRICNQQSRIRACNELMDKFQEFRAMESFQIRIYQDNPNSFLLLTDNSVYMSPYLRQKFLSESVPYVEIDPSEKELIRSYKTHFESIWVDKDNTESIWHVFNWHEIPGEHNERLKEFLRIHCKINWVKDAIIEKTDNGMTIKASLGERSLYIGLNTEMDKATVEVNGNQIAKFEAMRYGDKLKLYWI